MSMQAFGPRSQTYHVAVTSTASAASQVPGNPSAYTYQLMNIGSKICYFWWTADGSAVAVSPLTSSPAPGIALLPNEIIIYSLVPQAYFSWICDAGNTTDVLINCGEGM